MKKHSANLAEILQGLLFLLSVSMACTPAPVLPTSAPVAIPTSARPTPTVSPPVVSATRTTSAPNLSPQVIVDLNQGGDVQLSVGETFAVRLPSPDLDWQLTYPSDLLFLLTPVSKLKKPDAPGWVLQAIAPGEGDLNVLSLPGPCPSIDPLNPCFPQQAVLGFRFSVRK
jgi:hypothetical protein